MKYLIYKTFIWHTKTIIRYARRANSKIFFRLKRLYYHERNFYGKYTCLQMLSFIHVCLTLNGVLKIQVNSKYVFLQVTQNHKYYSSSIIPKQIKRLTHHRPTYASDHVFVFVCKKHIHWVKTSLYGNIKPNKAKCIRYIQLLHI